MNLLKKTVNVNPVVHIEKISVATDTVVLSTRKLSTKPKVEPLLRLHKMMTQEIYQAKKLLIKKKPKPKPKVQASKQFSKVKTWFNLTLHGVKWCKYKYNYKRKVWLCKEAFLT